MTKKLASWFNEYSEYHSTKGNQISHFVGIPLIAISLLGFFSMVRFGGASLQDSLFRPDLGWILFSAAMAFYLYLDWKIALPFGFVLVGFYFIGRSLSNQVALLAVMQVLGWGVQYIGHLRYEKNRPAFHRNLVHMLIGPIWIFSKLIRYGQ